jgi:hypothetical protein
MIDLSPIDVLHEASRGDDVPLPPELARLYGRLCLPAHDERPHVVGNFVTSLDGVVSLNEQNLSGGGEISGFNKHDQMVMGILRAAADAVRRAVVETLFHGDRVALVSTLDDALLGVRPRPAGYFAAIAS